MKKRVRKGYVRINNFSETRSKKRVRGKDKRKRCPKGMRMQEDGCQTISKYDNMSKKQIAQEADKIHRKNLRNPFLRLLGYR